MLSRFNPVRVVQAVTLVVFIGLPLVAHARTYVRIRYSGGDCESLSGQQYDVSQGDCDVTMKFGACEPETTVICNCALNGMQYQGGDCTGADLGAIWE